MKSLWVIIMIWKKNARRKTGYQFIKFQINFIWSNVVLLLHVGTTQNGIPCDALDEYGVVSDSVYFRERCRIHDVMVR